VSAELVISGIDEELAALRALPDALDKEGETAVRATTELTASQLKTSYPSAELKDGVRTRYLQGVPGVEVGRVESLDEHANLWEFGTQDRQTAQGWKRGRSPEHRQQGLVPLAIRNRRRMVERLVKVVQGIGFEVTGDGTSE